MLKNNGKITIRRNLLFCLCVLCLVFTSFGLSVENSFAADLNDTSDEMGMVRDDGNIQVNSQENQLRAGDTQDDLLGATRTPSGQKFSDIQTCINEASAGDTILLSGTYTATDANSRIKINKKLTITSSSTAVLNGKDVTRIFRINATGVTIKNLKFINAYGDTGAAIKTFAKNTLIQDCTFENNHCFKGGVVATDDDLYNTENFKVINCKFINNNGYQEDLSKYSAAGAIAAYSMNVEIRDCLFDSNWVKSNIDCFGGALQVGLDVPQYHATISNCIFKNNKAISANGNSHGGAGCVRNGVEYKNCQFINNQADEGGALTMHASGTIENCIFTGNIANKFGGAISSGYLYDSMILNIVKCTFDSNTAPNGGAIQAMGLNINIANSDFKNNRVTQNGGAVNIDASKVTVQSSNFTENRADVNGGAIYIKGDETTVSDSIFISNKAVPDKNKLNDGLGGAIFVKSTEASILRNSFELNTARNGSAIYYDSTGNNLIITGNALYQNQAWVYRLPISKEDIYYGDSETIKVVIYGGNNLANYDNLAISNAIYNAADYEKIEVDGQYPVDGATNDGRLYQDDREYNIPIQLTVTHQDGTQVYKNTLNSSYLGEINITLDNLKPGEYTVLAQHYEDTYYKAITNTSTFMVYPKVDNKVTVTTNSSTFDFDDVVVWTVNITNLGPNDASNVIVTNILPEGLTWINDDCDDKYDPRTGILDIGDLPVGKILTYNIITLIEKTGQLTNKVNITSDELDINLKNNYDEKSINVAPASDLAVIKMASIKEPNYPDQITWTIRVSNNGPDTAHNVYVRDVLPKSLIFIDSDGNYNKNSGIWDIGTLEKSQTITLNINCKVDSTGMIENNVTVIGDEFDYDLSNNNDSEKIFVNRAANTGVEKSVNASNVNYGDFVKWTLKITNKGPDDATNVVITDILPEGFIFITSTLNYTNNQINVPLVKVGEKLIIDIITQANITGTFVNIANVSSDEYDYDLTDNEDKKPVSVNPASDLEVKKTVSEENPSFNEEITWTIVVTNNGPDVAHNILIKDLFSNSLIWIDDDSEGKYNPKTGELKLDSLNVGDSFTLNIDCIVNGTGDIQNNVTVKADEYDYNMVNNKDNVTIGVENSADVSIVKLVSNPTPNYKDLVTWTLIISNKGPDKANNIVVDEVLPEGLIFINYTATKGIYVDDTWIMCCLENGEEVRLDILTRVNKTGAITNIASIHADEYDYDLTNNEDNATINVPLAVDMEVIIQNNNSSPYFGESVNWIITIRNNGPDDATEVILNEILPEELILQDHSLLKGSFSDGKWSAGSLKVGESQVLNVTTVSNALGKLINNVNVESKEYDWNKLNNLDDSAIDVKPVTDLSVIKFADNPNPKYGEIVRWTVKVTNDGPNDAHNVLVYETLPEGLTFIQSNGNYRNGIWNVGNLNNGESKELVISCKVGATGVFVNKVNVVCDEFDSDLSNNQYEESVIAPPASDLSVTKIASKFKYVEGDVIKYVIEVVNNGPDTAHNIKVKEILDDLLKLKSFKVTKGKFNKFDFTWTIDSLDYGESAILYLKVIATGSGIIKNKVSVTSDTFDYDLSNNKDFAIVNVTKKPVNDTLNASKNLNGGFAKKSLSILEKHPTGNPFWNLILVLVFSLIFLNDGISKKR